MKRAAIMALAAASAMGVTALVGGVGLASALDVADQAGRTLDVRGVSTVDDSRRTLADAPTLDDAAVPSDDPTADDATPDDPATGAPTDDDGTADQGSGDVDEVAPADPVVIGDDHAARMGEDCDDRGPALDAGAERSRLPGGWDDRGADRDRGGDHGRHGGGWGGHH